jgi:hypothetical protein
MLSLKDHRIINKYLFEYLKVNSHIKNNFDKSIFFGRKKTIKMSVNALIVSPNHINVYLFLSLIHLGRLFTAPSKDGLEHYVSFSRARFSPMVKSWCDWCSMVNGYWSFLINAINEFYETHPHNHPINKSILLKYSILLWQTKSLTIMLDKADYFPRNIIKPKELFPFIEEAHPSVQSLTQKLTNSYNIIQEVERHWCPFQHMQQIAQLAHADKDRYQNYLTCESFADLMKAGDLIFHFKHLKCNQCVDVINTHLGVDSTDSETNLTKCTDNFFSLICRLTKLESQFKVFG